VKLPITCHFTLYIHGYMKIFPHVLHVTVEKSIYILINDIEQWRVSIKRHKVKRYLAINI